MTLKLNGSSSGSVSIDAPASTAGGADRTLTLPDKTATMSPRMVLEQFYCPCDGSTITTSNGDITIVDKDDNQALTTSWADVLGSTIAYNPPTGTTQVIYEYQFNGMRNGDDALPIGHFKFFIDSDEVTEARTNFAGQYTEMNMLFKWAINIGGSAVTATGRQASWSSAKTLKLQAREYASGNEFELNRTFYWDGAGSADPQFHRPQIGITAIG